MVGQLIQWLKSHRAWVLVGLTILFVAVVRVRLRDMSLERDEGEYAYAGQLILHGVPPYKEVYNMKLPGTYLAYALIVAVFGQTPAGIHFGVMLVNAGAIVLIFMLGRRLLDDATGVVAVVVYALMSLSPSVLGLAGHATHFVVLPALGGMLLLMRSAECRARNPRMRNAECGVRNEEDGGQTNGGQGTTDEGRVRNSETRGPKAERRPASEVRSSKFNVQGSRFKVHPFPFCNPQSAIRISPLRIFLSGLLFGIAFLMKQHGIFFALFGLSYLLWSWFADWRESREEGKGVVRESRELDELPQGEPRRLSHFAAGKRGKEMRNAEKETPNPERRTSNLEPRTSGFGNRPSFGLRPSVFGIGPSSLLPALGLFVAGLLLPYALTCLVLWLTGAFRQFVFWTISYAAQYASANSPVNGPELLKGGLRSVVGPNLPFWLLPWFGALVMWWEHRFVQVRSSRTEVRGSKFEVQGSRFEARGARSAIRSPSSVFRLPSSASPRFFLTALLFCSFASASVGFYFRGHYFIVVLPVLALLSGVAVSRGLYLVKYDRTIELFLAAPILLLFVVGLGASLIGNSAVWFAPSALEAHRQTYRTTLFTQAAAAAEYIKAHTAKDARIAVLGSEPEIYFLSGRRSVTGYIYMYPIMEDQPYARKMQEEMIGQVERGRPEYVVYVVDDSSWRRSALSQRRMDEWWEAYWLEHFDPVMTFGIEEGLADAPEPASPDKPGKTGPAKRLLLLKRKA